MLGQFQSQDPLTGAQYKEAVSGEASDSSEIRPSKRRRTVVPDSQDTGGLSSNDHALDNPGTIEYSSNHRLKKIVVELPQNSGLNPLEYLHVQLSESSQPRSVPEIVEDHLFQPPAASSLKEQRDSNRTIPDSQEPSAFSAPETGLRESQPNTDLINSNPSSQASTSQEHSSLSDTSQRLSGTVTGIEIPSHQPELRTCEQVTIPDSGLETWPVEPSLPAKSGVEISSEHHSVSQSLFDPTTFQTQEPFDSQPGAPTSPAGTAQTTSNQNQAGPLVSLHPSQTLSVRSSQFFSIRHPQPAPAAVSDTSSQAAQIVPHSLSHSQDISSQSLFPQGFSVYNSGYSDNDIVPGSSPPRFEHVGSQTSSQVLSQLDGNIRISSSTSIWQGLVSRPKSLHPPSQIQTDKLSTIIKADEAQVEGCHLSSQPLSYSHSPSYGSQLSDRSLRRHSGRPVTPNNKMDDAAPTSEKPVSMKDRLRLIRERRFNSTPSMTPSPVAVERTADGVSSAVQVADVQDTSNAPSAVLDVNSFVSELLPLPVAPEYEEPQTISPALLAPSVGMLHRGVQPIFGIGLDDAAIYERTTITTSYEPAAEEHPTTLDPSALTLSIENDVVEADNEMDDSPLIPTDNGQSGTDGAESIDEPLAANNDAFAAPKPNILPSIDSGPYEFIVTLPLASNIRPQYADIIKETNDDLVAYNAAFTIPPYHAPEAALVAKVDEMFNRLLDICDLPPDLETLQKISPPKVAKFIRTSNSKYAFVGQFLELLARNKTIEKSVLLIARPGPIVDLLNTFLETSGFQPDESVITPISKSWSSDNLFITVYPSANRSYDLRTDYDVIIAFDHTYRRDFLPDALQENPPITLILVTTTSLQHINMRISEQIESLSRKNYLLLALCASINVMLHAKPGHPQAHEAAATFANLVCAPDDDDFYWTHSEPPESIFEHIAASSQLDVAHSTLLPDAGIDRRSSRKRSLVSSQSIAPQLLAVLILW